MSRINLLEKFNNLTEKAGEGFSETVLRQHRRRKKIFFIAKLVVSVFMIIVVLLAALSYQVISSGQSLYDHGEKKPSFFSQIKSLLTSDERPLTGEVDDRINILLLGIGGKDHAGADLTDTIIIASLVPSTKKVAMISLPRDLAIPIANYGWRKINRINSFGEEREKGSGAKLAAQTLSETFDIPIHYYARIDFEGFIKAIDKLGGVKVYVDNTIDDSQYPVLGKEEDLNYKARFEHLYIEKGWQEMDGELALKYARSRHTPGLEGSDFARAKRQQKIITALRDKAFSFSTLLNPIKLSGLLNTFENHINTNLQIWEIIKLSHLLGEINLAEVANYVFDDSPQGVLYSATIDGAYVLQPKTGDFSEMQFIIKNVFNLNNLPGQKAAAETKEKVTLEIRNGTKITGLASKTAAKLMGLGYPVIKIDNAPEQDYEKTVIYDLSNGAKPKTIAALKALLDANVTTEIPAWINSSWQEVKPNNNLDDQANGDTEKITTNADILIVLGLDQK